MTNMQGAPPPIRPRISHNIPQLHDDAITIKHEKIKIQQLPNQPLKKKIKKRYDREHKKFQAIMKKNCPPPTPPPTCQKKNNNFAFNYTNTVEQTCTRSILIKGYPNDKAKK